MLMIDQSSNVRVGSKVTVRCCCLLGPLRPLKADALVWDGTPFGTLKDIIAKTREKILGHFNVIIVEPAARLEKTD